MDTITVVITEVIYTVTPEQLSVGGDMYKYIYDIDGDGIVDQANKIDGGTFG